MYPMLREEVLLSVRQFSPKGKKHYLVENEDGDIYEVDREVFVALTHADGTRPLRLPDRGKEVIPILKEEKIIQTSRYVHFGGKQYGLTLLPIGGKVWRLRGLCRRISRVLPVGSVFIFLLGLSMTLFAPLYGARISLEKMDFWLYLILVTVTLLMHELGHIITGIACGQRVRTIGILLLVVLPVGAYVSYAPEPLNRRQPPGTRDLIQFSMGGIEMNVLTAGVFLLLSRFLHGSAADTFLFSAAISVELALYNLLPIFGLDGDQALGAVFGVSSVSSVVRLWVTSKGRRKRFFCDGLAGWICLGITLLVAGALLIIALAVLAEVCYVVYIVIDLVRLFS